MGRPLESEKLSMIVYSVIQIRSHLSLCKGRVDSCIKFLSFLWTPPFPLTIRVQLPCYAFTLQLLLQSLSLKSYRISFLALLFFYLNHLAQVFLKQATQLHATQ